MARPGPKLKTVDWDEFDKLVSYQCTQEEIASFFDMSLDTLETRCLQELGVRLSEVWNKRSFAGKVKLRKLQYRILEKGGSGAATLAIYLDKKVFPNENPDHLDRLQDTPPQEIAENFSRTFSEFCENAGYYLPFPVQEEMRIFAFEVDIVRMLLGARGYGKTDYVTILGTAYDIYKNGFNSTNLIISESRSRNTAICEEISQALKSNGLTLDRDNQSEIRISGHKGKEHNVEMITMKASFRGRHPKRIIFDDPATETSEQEAQRKLVKRKYDEAYKLCKNIVLIGQPVHSLDIYATLKDTVKTFEVPHGTIPELDADLDAMAIAGVDERSISMSYHLKVPKQGDSIFSNLKMIDSIPGGDKVAFIDPSDGGDYTAMTIFRGYMQGMGVEGKVYKRAWFHCMDDIIAVLKAKGVKRIAFETNATGDAPIGMWQKALDGTGIGVVKWYSVSNKHQDIVNAGSYAHMIHLSKESDKVYTDQVINYDQSAKYDDAPDSLARGLKWIGLIK